jgi:hypothetical protein
MGPGDANLIGQASAKAGPLTRALRLMSLSTTAMSSPPPRPGKTGQRQGV